MKITIATAFNASYVPFHIHPKTLFADRLPNTPTNPRNMALFSSLTVKCSRNDNDSESSSRLKDVLSGLVDDRVEELLNKDENRVLLDGLEKATLRVETAKRELAEIEKQEAEAKLMRDYIKQLETRATEIAECQKEILEARAMVEQAEESLVDGGDEGGGALAAKSEAIQKDEERLESIKAASVSAVIGTLAGLPISLTRVTSSSELILPVAVTFFSCALFGVTFRYAVRRDLDDFHLKSGTCAAFGFVKGLATLGGGPPLELDANSIISHAFNGSVYVSENLLIFLFAAVGLDFCMKLRILSPFPIDRSIPKT